MNRYVPSMAMQDEIMKAFPGDSDGPQTGTAEFERHGPSAKQADEECHLMVYPTGGEPVPPVVLVRDGRKFVVTEMAVTHDVFDPASCKPACSRFKLRLEKVTRVEVRT